MSDYILHVSKRTGKIVALIGFGGTEELGSWRVQLRLDTIGM